MLYSSGDEQLSINRTGGTGVHVAVLNNKTVRADGRPMPPYKYLLHDTNHAEFRDVDDPRFLIRLQHRLRRITGSQREAVEYIYFEVDHENVLRSLRDIADIREIIKKLTEAHDRVSNNSIDRYNNRINYNYIRPILPFLPRDPMNTYLSFLLSDDDLISGYRLSFPSHDATRIYESIGNFLTEGSETFIRFVLEVHEELGINTNY